jgi:uroporphyrinogen III methyltransferase/synthase
MAGVDALKNADIVVYDRLVNPRLLAYAPPEADKIFAGKASGNHTFSQDVINSLLVDYALSGKTVVRLKGGDPFVFGRGGEEAEALLKNDIPFLVVPGVTSAVAAPAYAGIPVTHRGISESFAVITAHEKEQLPNDFHLDAYADTLVFLMGASSLPQIVESLIASGRPGDTPMAAIQWGCWAGKQKTVVGCARDIVQKVTDAQLGSPMVIVAGKTVMLREKLRWWDNRALSGKRILVTRAKESVSSFSLALSNEGAEPIEFPVIQIVAPPDRYAALDDAISRLRSYDWLVFTSVNAVHAFWDRLMQMGGDSRVLVTLRVASVGPSTGAALRQLGIVPDFTPTVFTAEETALQFPDSPPVTSVLFPCAAEANDALPKLLRERDMSVDVVPVYETIAVGAGAEAVIQRLKEQTVDIITFTSSSTVKNFVAALGANPPSLENIEIACIGPVTAQTVRELFQREPDIIAEDYTIPGLIDALKAAYAAD